MIKSTVEFDDLPMDVFDLIDEGLNAESLTTGHGITEIGASNCGGTSPACSNCCSFCCCSPCHY